MHSLTGPIEVFGTRSQLGRQDRGSPASGGAFYQSLGLPVPRFTIEIVGLKRAELMVARVASCKGEGTLDKGCREERAGHRRSVGIAPAQLCDRLAPPCPELPKADLLKSLPERVKRLGVSRPAVRAPGNDVTHEGERAWTHRVRSERSRPLLISKELHQSVLMPWDEDVVRLVDHLAQHETGDRALDGRAVVSFSYGALHHSTSIEASRPDSVVSDALVQSHDHEVGGVRVEQRRIGSLMDLGECQVVMRRDETAATLNKPFRNVRDGVPDLTIPKSGLAADFEHLGVRETRIRRIHEHAACERIA